jgi:hypothetical protein
MVERRYGEAKIYAGLVGGSALCLWLFTAWLPSIGMGAFAHQFEAYADKAAPCLLSPVVAWLIVRLKRRGRLPFILGLIGGIAFLFWFFVIFELPLAFVGLGVLGAAVILGYRSFHADGVAGRRRDRDTVLAEASEAGG